MIEGSLTKALLDAVPAVLPGLVEAAAPQTEASESQIKKIGLFMAAPFIGLAYAVALPFAGLGALAYMGIRAFAKSSAPAKLLTFTKNVALFIAAPFLGLLYALLLPVVGLATLAWMGIKALRRNAGAMKVVKFIGGFVAAPFVGLAFILVLPYLGAAALVWIAVRGWTGARTLVAKIQAD
jgi:hypothetical protein